MELNNSVNVHRLLYLQCVSPGVTSINILIVKNNKGPKRDTSTCIDELVTALKDERVIVASARGSRVNCNYSLR